MITDIPGMIRVFAASAVEFIVIGGVAATAHGSARSTVDLDVVYRQTQENVARLAAALAPYQPYLRGAPPGLPFRFDEQTIWVWTGSQRHIDLIRAGTHCCKYSHYILGNIRGLL